MRPYQKDGFDFLCHLHNVKLGGILADDMGLGQDAADARLAGVAQGPTRQAAQALPGDLPRLGAAQLAARGRKFTPAPEGAGAGERRRPAQPAQTDPATTISIVTNYALLRRDLEELQKFEFQSLILDEAQFIKNPGAQVTQSREATPGADTASP